MLTRILTGVVSFLIFLPCLVFSDTPAFPAAMAVCAVAAVFELLRCVGMHRNPWVAVPLYLAAAAAPVLLRLSRDPLGAPDRFLPIATAVWLLITLYLLTVSVLSHGKTDIALTSAALLLSGYVIAGFTAAVFLRDFHEGGASLFLLPFLGAWTTDIFAYFTGRLCGRHRLIPDVSPKKTVEGSVGGTLACVLVFVLFAVWYNRRAGAGRAGVPVWLMAAAGLAAAAAAQIGDLAMSALKRRFGVKDFGRAFPGHGGFLDRFDSVLAVSVLLACVLGPTLGGLP